MTGAAIAALSTLEIRRLLVTIQPAPPATASSIK